MVDEENVGVLMSARKVMSKVSVRLSLASQRLYAILYCILDEILLRDSQWHSLFIDFTV